MGRDTGIRRLQARNEVLHAFASHDKVRRVFGPQPETPLEAGIRKMAAWVQHHGAQQTKPFAAIEIPQGLPQGW